MPSLDVEAVETEVPRYLRNVGESPVPDEFLISGKYFHSYVDSYETLDFDLEEVAKL